MKPALFVVAALAWLLAGQTVTATDTYQLDAAHTEVGFTIDHLVINTVRGRFKEVAGTVTLDGSAVTAATATIQTKSIDTGIDKRDDHLRSADFFGAEQHSTLTFESTKVQDGVLTGKLTMHGVTRDVELPYTLKGPIKDPWGNARVGIRATAKLNRKDYGLMWNKALETGGLVVGEEVTIEINAEAVKK